MYFDGNTLADDLESTQLAEYVRLQESSLLEYMYKIIIKKCREVDSIK